MAISTQVLIIGNDLPGLMTAYHLQKHGKRVAILDAPNLYQDHQIIEHLVPSSSKEAICLNAELQTSCMMAASFECFPVTLSTPPRPMEPDAPLPQPLPHNSPWENPSPMPLKRPKLTPHPPFVMDYPLAMGTAPPTISFFCRNSHFLFRSERGKISPEIDRKPRLSLFRISSWNPTRRHFHLNTHLVTPRPC